MTSITRLGAVAGMLIALSGCASITPIGDLLNNPARYDGKTVKIEGKCAMRSVDWGSALSRSVTKPAPSRSSARRVRPPRERGSG